MNSGVKSNEVWVSSHEAIAFVVKRRDEFGKKTEREISVSAGGDCNRSSNDEMNSGVTSNRTHTHVYVDRGSGEYRRQFRRADVTIDDRAWPGGSVVVVIVHNHHPSQFPNDVVRVIPDAPRAAH